MRSGLERTPPGSPAGAPERQHIPVPAKRDRNSPGRAIPWGERALGRPNGRPPGTRNGRKRPLKHLSACETVRPPHLGLASAAVLQGDFDTAIKAYWTVRDKTSDQHVQRAMSAAIQDLQKIMRTVPD